MKKHRFLSVLTALTVLTCGMSGYIASAAAKGSGDVDENGSVQIADAILLARYIAEDTDITVTTQGLLNADMNGDEAVNADDAAALLSWLAGTETFPPAAGRSVDLLEGYARGGGKAEALGAEFSAAQLDFTAKLLKELDAEKEDKGGNLLISPLSVSLALGMTMNGAKGQTQSEMLSLLGGSLTAEQLNGSYLSWQNSILNRKDAQLDLANAIWFRDNEARIIVPETFRQTVADYFDASLYKAPFDETTPEDVNGWVKEKTHEMIPSILKKVEPEHIMYLLNALAFEAEWAQQYAKEQVGSGVFCCADGTARQVTMMHGEESTYIESKNAVGFIKPFAGDGKSKGSYSFAAVLPNKGISIEEYVQNLNAEELQTLLKSRKTTTIQTAMPQFSFDFGKSLKPALANLGMPTAFSDYADFSGLNERATPENPTFIEDVIHKTFIDVGPAGAKAGAATLVIMADKGMPFDVKHITLDRPFLFMILDNETDLPVFIGTLLTPDGEEIVPPVETGVTAGPLYDDTTTTTEVTTEHWDCDPNSGSSSTTTTTTTSQIIYWKTTVSTTTMVYENPVIRTTAAAE